MAIQYAVMFRTETASASGSRFVGGWTWHTTPLLRCSSVYSSSGQRCACAVHPWPRGSLLSFIITSPLGWISFRWLLHPFWPYSCPSFLPDISGPAVDKAQAQAQIPAAAHTNTSSNNLRPNFFAGGGIYIPRTWSQAGGWKKNVILKRFQDRIF